MKILGTWYEPVGTRFGSLEHLKKTDETSTKNKTLAP